jgi:ribosomal-protein-alanine N-acetyltransferase
MLIRHAAESDLSHLAWLESVSFPEPWSATSLGGALAHAANLTIVVQEPCGESLLSAYLILRLAADEAELLRLAVHPQQRRLGLGQSLLTHALRVLGARQIRVCFLEVRADNEAALELYRRFPTRQVSRRPAYYRDGCDALVLALQVDTIDQTYDS